MKSPHLLPFILIIASVCSFLNTTKANDAQIKRAKSDITAITVVLDSSKKLYSTYPTTEQGLLFLVNKPKDYIDKWVQFFTDIPMDPWNRVYVYRIPGIHNPHSYDVFSLGPDGKFSDDDIGNWPSKTEQDAAANL